MAQETLNDGELQGVQRNKINNNFNELFEEIPFSVNSVNGKTGDVVLDKDDIGLDQVDNTSDVDKPVSTAQQAELVSQVEFYIDLRNIDITGLTDNSQVSVSHRDTTSDKGGGEFFWNGSDLSAEVTADTLSGIFVAPTSDLTGASGAWVRQQNDTVDPRWFDAALDGITDDKAVFDAIISLFGVTAPAAVSSDTTQTFVNLNGQTAGIGSSISLDGFGNLTFENGAFEAVGGAWTETDYMFDLSTALVYTESTTSAIANINFHDIKFRGMDLCNIMFLRNTRRTNVVRCVLSRFTFYGINTSDGNAGATKNGELFLDKLYITQGELNEGVWSGFQVDVPSGITNGRGIGLSLNNADGMLTNSIIHQCRICLQMDNLSNFQTQGNHFFGPARYATPLTVALVSNSGGAIRVTTTVDHLLETDELVEIASILGTTEANGWWRVTKISDTVFDLQNSVFTNAYVSGGTVEGYNYNVLVGTRSDSFVSSGLHFVNNYLDAIPTVFYGQFKHAFVGNMVTASNARLILIANAVDENATGFMCVGNRIQGDPELVLSEHGTWDEDQLDMVYSDNASAGGGDRPAIFGLTDIYPGRSVREGKLAIGHTATPDAQGFNNIPSLQTSGTGGAGDLGGIRYGADTVGPRLQLTKSRGAGVGERSSVLAGDTVGEIMYTGDDGTDLTTQLAIISVEADTTLSSSKQSSIHFKTRNVGDGAPVDRVKIDPAGNLGPISVSTAVLGGFNEPWLRVFADEFRPGGAATTVVWTSGTGSPEGVVSGGVASMYTDKTGGAGTTLYIKESGTGNLGWIAK